VTAFAQRRGVALAALLALGALTAQAAGKSARVAGDVPIDGANIYSMSITSTADGTLLNGSMSGIV
jgi:hypothetical protein